MKAVCVNCLACGALSEHLSCIGSFCAFLGPPEGAVAAPKSATIKTNISFTAFFYVFFYDFYDLRFHVLFMICYDLFMISFVICL